jgi:hypothetical protein
MNTGMKGMNANLLVTLFVGITIISGIGWASYGLVKDKADQVAAVTTSNAQTEAAIANAKATIALEPQVLARLARLAHINAQALAGEHEAIVRCAKGLTVSAYSISSDKDSVGMTVAGPQNNMLRFLDCMDTLPILLAPASITIANGDHAGVTLTYQGALVHG